MGYWQSCILKNFSSKTVQTHGKLKRHREVWVGAILAAGQTKASKKATGRHIQHFVGLPNGEPSDVDVVRLVETTMPSGRTGTKLERLNIQITRCNLDEGETVLEQILKKNKPAYEGLILVVYVHGLKLKGDSEAIHQALKAEAVIYPSQIISVELAERTVSVILARDSYGLSQLYPGRGSSVINLHDPEAFFRSPDVIKADLPRGVTTQWQDLGRFELLPPTIG